MIAVGLALLAGVALGAGAALLASRAGRRPGRGRHRPDAPGRLLLPFAAGGLTEPALSAALRLARSQGDVLVPVALLIVPLRLPPDAALPRQAERALEALEAIDVAARLQGVAVDARIERGRSLRHALAEALDHEPAGRVVVPAGPPGFAPDDVAWLLDKAVPEVVALRPRRST